MENQTHPCKDCPTNTRIFPIKRGLRTRKVLYWKPYCPKLDKDIDLDVCKQIIRLTKTRAWRLFEKAKKYIE